MNSRNEYPLCRDLGLEIKYDVNGEINSYFRLADLEAVLQKAVVVYGGYQHSKEHAFTEHQYPYDTHQALLIGIKPIKEKTTLEKISEVLEKFRETNNNLYLADEIKKLIEDANEKRD